LSQAILTVANQLTLLRLTLVPAVVALVLSAEFTWALVVFVVAGLTDLLDGLIARLGHQKTTLGAFLDPVADKVLLSSSFISLTWASDLHVKMPAWLTVTTLTRDAIILVAVAAINLTYGRRVFLPSLLGKLSTAAQIVTAGAVLLLNALSEPFPPILYLFFLTLGLAVASGLHYVYLASTPKGGGTHRAVEDLGGAPEKR
jgi:cardiolipin synthase